jgi:hypothetical protein
MNKTTLLDRNKEIYLHANGRMIWVQMGDYCLARAGEWGFQVFVPPQKQRADGNRKLAFEVKAPIPISEQAMVFLAFLSAVDKEHGLFLPGEALDSIPSTIWSKG